MRPADVLRSRGLPGRKVLPGREDALAARSLLAAALPAWLVSRALALACWLGTLAAEGGHLPRTGDIGDAKGLWVWDAGWYRSIAQHGYKGSPAGGVRFFPLLPEAGRLLGHVVGVDAALLLIANLSALCFAMAVTRLAMVWVPPDAVRWAPWFVLLGPGGLSFVLAFTEPVWALACACFLCCVVLRERGSWWAVAAGLCAGLARPTGFLIAVVPALLLLRRRRLVAPQVAAVLAPLVGAGIYCLWLQHAYGKPWLAYSTQATRGLRGAIVADPVRGLLESSVGAQFPVFKVLMAFAGIVLLGYAWRLLPLEVWCWTALLLLAALTSANGESLPRYLTGDFPLLLTLAAVVRRPRVATLSLSAGLFAAIAVLAFTDTMVL